jgi:hypothetical protein
MLRLLGRFFSHRSAALRGSARESSTPDRCPSIRWPRSAPARSSAGGTTITPVPCVPAGRLRERPRVLCNAVGLQDVWAHWATG